MAPRSGGEADKFGNRYEGIWTVRQLLEVLHGRAQSLTVESTDEAGEGVEFILERRAGATEAHQVKRQRGSANSWSLRVLRDEGVLAAAEKHVDAGREFHFVSLLPCTALRELADRARRSADLKHLVEGQLTARSFQSDFDFLGSEIWGTPQRAWEVLRGIHARWPDEQELRDSNAALAGVLLDGAPAPTAALVLGDLIADTLALPLEVETVKGRLGPYELRFAPLAARGGVRERVSSLTDAWRKGTVAEMLDPPIPRGEATEITERLENEERLLLASGNAGDGKTGVLNQVVEKVATAGWPILAIRLDRRESFESAFELGDQLKLPASPAATLAAIAGGGPALLLIDQLDALSLASGRMPESFGAVEELLREAAVFPEMRVLLAARQFDIDNDNRLRGLVGESGRATQFKIDVLSDEQVGKALLRMGIDKAALGPQQLEILRSPLHLVLLGVVAAEVGALAFARPKDLFDHFWESKARTCRLHPSQPRFTKVIDALLDAMSAAQQLAAPAAALDSGDLLADAGVLTSEHVLVRDGQQLAFFHEAFFDYAFARRWIRRGEGVVEFLLSGGQELFRRAQVRQILAHLRDEDPNRYLREVSDVLMDDRVRFHIKDVVLGMLRSLPDPTAEEWAALEALLSEKVSFEERLWSAVRSVGWFDRLLVEGKLAAWLSGDNDGLRGRAVDIMVSAVVVRVDEVTVLLGPLSEREDFAKLLLWLARFAPIERSRALFELLLTAAGSGAIDSGEEELWLDVHGLGEKEPDWAVELVHAFLVERPASLRLGDNGQVADLDSRDHGLLELVSKAAGGAPVQFCELLLGYLLEVMAATSEGGDAPIRDAHFSHRYWQADIHQLDDALLYGMRKALDAIAVEEPGCSLTSLERLERDPHDAAQWLLFEGLRAAGETHANWAAQILLQGEHRLESGYSSSRYWTTRQLLEAVAAYIDDELFERLEKMLLAFTPAWEGKWRGSSSFALLSALPEARLSVGGRRGLGELRRKFEQEHPPEPMGIRIGTVRSPISQAAAEHMTDEQWMAAIAKYATGERWSRIELVGDASELAQVLEAETKQDAERFATLALRFTPETHPAYTNAVLRAVGHQEASIDPESVFALMRHVDGLARPENDTYFGDALRQHLDAEIPDEVIEIILQRALCSVDPEEETWQRQADDGSSYRDPWSQGMNTVRGRAAEVMGDLLVRDADGRRSALLAPRLAELARDPSVAVRSCVARLISGSLRYERPTALAAFALLVDADDRLLATRPVEQLLIDIGWAESEIINPPIERMLASEFEPVREVGGRLAAFAGLELGLNRLLSAAVASPDAATRKGAAELCANILSWTSNAEAATAALLGFFDDAEEDVRAAAAEVAMGLRGKDLTSHVELLRSLIVSLAFPQALAQLLFTLEGTAGGQAELGLECAERFLATKKEAMGDIRTSAAADSRHIGELLLRTYSQSTKPGIRDRALDAIDELLLAQAHGIDELVADAER